MKESPMLTSSRGCLDLRMAERCRTAKRHYTWRPLLEQLEGRLVLTTTFNQTDLVSDIPGMAKITDPNLVNPWGMALGLNSGLWVSGNRTGKATAYDGTGQAIASGSPLVVTIPGPGGMGSSSPTGVVTNGTTGFVISSAGKS